MQDKNALKRILYVIQLPPPVHGVSIINNTVCNSEIINSGLIKKIVRLNFSKRFDELRKFSFKKLIIFFAVALKITLALIRFKPHAVYFTLMPIGYGFIRDFLFSLIIKFSKSKVIFHFHNNGISRFNLSPLYRTLYRITFRNCSIIHLSNTIINKEFKNIYLKNVKIFCLPNGVADIPTSNENKHNPEIEILFISNLIIEKGIIDLLNVFNSIVKSKKFKVLLNIAGSPTKLFNNKFKRFINANPELKNRIKFHGPCYDNKKYDLLNNADIFVLPSYFSQECMPLAILEAMAAGLPIVSTRIGAIPEIVEHSKNGLLTNPRDISGLKTNIETLLNNEILRNVMGEKSREIYLSKFSQPIFEKKMYSILNEILLSNK